MPVCARCFGAAIGQLIALFAWVVVGFPPYLISATLMLPMGIDWSAQEYVGIASTNQRRLITGLLGGFGLSCLTFKALSDLMLRCTTS